MWHVALNTIRTNTQKQSHFISKCGLKSIGENMECKAVQTAKHITN